ncbi:hypothetical protein TYRP_001787 [Tyrophagus putrescentiae]|nr:hypothetical protein TYRP_001787 [Tyrophagus putrescentiae]
MKRRRYQKQQRRGPRVKFSQVVLVVFKHWLDINNNPARPGTSATYHVFSLPDVFRQPEGSNKMQQLSLSFFFTEQTVTLCDTDAVPRQNMSSQANI